MVEAHTLRALARALQTHDDVVRVVAWERLTGDRIIVRIRGQRTTAPIPAMADGVRVLIQTGTGRIPDRGHAGLLGLAGLILLLVALTVGLDRGLIAPSLPPEQRLWPLIAFSPILALALLLFLVQAGGELRELVWAWWDRH